MSEHCKDCKHWTQHEWNLPRKDKRKRADYLEGYGQCDVLSLRVAGLQPVVQDEDEGFNPVYTLPDFGCVQFEVKQDD